MKDNRLSFTSSFTLIARLFRIEVGRMARRWAFWLGVLVLAAIAWSNMVLGAASQQKIPGAFSYSAIQDNLLFVLPVFVGVVIAGSLAADRRRGYPPLVLVRGISRTYYLLTKAASMFSVAMFGTFLSCALAFAVAAFFLPWAEAATSEYANRGSMGPYPGLLANHPFTNDVVLAALFSLGAGALVLSGLAFGAAVANEYVAAAVPFVLFAGGIFVFRGALLFLGPYTQLDLMSSYTYSLPQWAWSFTEPVYWCVFSFSCVTAAVVLFLKKEEI